MRHFGSLTHPSVQPRIDAGWPGEMIVSGLTIAQSWIQHRRQRRALASLDDRMLRDIGLTRFDAAKEINKPFWQG